MKSKLKKGFTLIEILLVVGITMTIALFTLPFLTSRVRQTDLEETVKGTISQIIQYQQYAYAGNGNTAYGISFSSDRYILFRGNSLISASIQETILLPTSISISSINLTSGNEVVFAYQSFRPSVNGVIRFNLDSQNIDVSINSEGMIRYTRV